MHKRVAVGGTFDGLHKGHRFFLTQAFAHGYHVTIALTSEAFIRRFKKDKGVAPYSKRYSALTSWLRSNHLAERSAIVPLDNRWGPAIMGEFDALLVTVDNKSIGQEINTVRIERGLPPVALIDVVLIPAQDLNPISSTRVRGGIIDGEGHLRLPDSLRLELSQPLGRLLVGDDIAEALRKNRDNVLITVGDVTTQAAFSCGVRPALAVIDLMVERKPFQTLEAYKFPKHYAIVRVQSGPGYISKAAIRAIASWAGTIRERKRTVLVVDGEEDLLALPAIIHAPVESVVYYGSPPSSGSEGMVEVVVTQETKKHVSSLLKKFV